MRTRLPRRAALFTTLERVASVASGQPLALGLTCSRGVVLEGLAR